MTDIDEIGSNSGCFHSSKRRKRKHSETTEENENKTKPEKKSLFSVISEKCLSFKWTKEELRTPPPTSRQPRSILSPNSSYASYTNFAGELNYSFEHDDGGFGASNFVTNNYYNNEYDDPPKKRVKFDEENIVVSSITYQRQQQAMRLENLKSSSSHQNKSIFAKFIDFTSNLF